MRNRKFEKLFKDEFNRKYSINLKTNDLFQETDFIPKKQNYNFWKYSSICSTCLLIISLVFIGYLLTFKLDLGYGDSKFQTIHFTEDNNILTKDEITYFREICNNGFHNESAQYLVIDENVTMYVYKGMKFSYTDSIGVEVVYLYVFTFNDTNRNIILNVDDNEYIINKNNRYGVLDSIDEAKKQEIIFSLTYYDNSNKYLYLGE